MMSCEMVPPFKWVLHVFSITSFEQCFSYAQTHTQQMILHVWRSMRLKNIRMRITIMIHQKAKGKIRKVERGWCEFKCDICDKCPITPFCRNVTVSFHRHESTTCNETADLYSNITLTSNQSCVNWHQYYTDCKAGVKNPFQGAISFDNIGLAWVAIFQVSTFHYVIVSIWEIRCFHIKYFPFLF